MRDAMIRIAAVGLGGGLGSVARDLLSSRLRLWATGFEPLGTLAVNVIGCFFIGALMAGVGMGRLESPQARLFLATGLLGGFTTFSAFGAETVELAGSGQIRAAAMNAALNLGLGLLAVAAGRASTQSMLG